jgi:hypothetical protein
MFFVFVCVVYFNRGYIGDVKNGTRSNFGGDKKRITNFGGETSKRKEQLGNPLRRYLLTYSTGQSPS